MKIRFLILLLLPIALSAREFVVGTDYTIEPDRVIEGDLLVIGGTCTIYGKVNGDIDVIKGKVVLKKGAKVRGDIKSYGGRIIREGESSVNGRIKNEIEIERYRDFDLEYSRVDGLTIGPIFEREGTESSPYSYSVIPLYSFSSKKFGYRTRFSKGFFYPNALEFGIKLYDFTATEDRWRFEQNGLAFLFIGEDFYDWFRRRGYSGIVSKRWKFCKITGEYGIDKLESLEKRTDFALFKGKKKIRPNPEIESGRYKTLNLKVRLGEKENYIQPYIKSINRKWLKYGLDGKLWRKIGEGYFCNIFGFLSLSRDSLPSFEFTRLGGIGSLPGYRFKQFEGENGWLLRINYGVIDKYLIGFDFGSAWRNSPVKSKTKIDFCIGLISGGVRLQFFKPLDKPEGKIRMVLNFEERL